MRCIIKKYENTASSKNNLIRFIGNFILFIGIMGQSLRLQGKLLSRGL